MQTDYRLLACIAQKIIHVLSVILEKILCQYSRAIRVFADVKATYPIIAAARLPAYCQADVSGGFGYGRREPLAVLRCRRIDEHAPPSGRKPCRTVTGGIDMYRYEYSLLASFRINPVRSFHTLLQGNVCIFGNEQGYIDPCRFKSCAILRAISRV